MYQHGKRTKRSKNPKVFVYTAFLFAAGLVIAAYILHKDLASRTEEKSPVPIITEIGQKKEDIILMNEGTFTFELPADWQKVNRVQNRVANYYEWRSTKKGGDDRLLRLHVDVMPPSYKVTRMLPLLPNGSGFTVGNVSGNCVNFATAAGGSERSDRNAPVEAKWEGVVFVCDPISANQTIGTGTQETGIAAKAGGHTYFFYFEDHNIRPDDSILINAVKSFSSR